MGPSGPHSHKDMTCTQSLIFGAFKHPKNPDAPLSNKPHPQPGSTSRFGMQQEKYGSVQLNPPYWWLTCLPWPGPSHQTASVATWEEKDGQTMLNPKEDQTQGSFSSQNRDQDMGSAGPSSPLDLQWGLGSLGVSHQPVEPRYPQVDVLLAESCWRKRRVMRLGWG